MAAHSKVVMIIIVMTTKIMAMARMVNTTGIITRSYQFVAVHTSSGNESNRHKSATWVRACQGDFLAVHIIICTSTMFTLSTRAFENGKIESYESPTWPGELCGHAGPERRRDHQFC